MQKRSSIIVIVIKSINFLVHIGRDWLRKGAATWPLGCMTALIVSWMEASAWADGCKPAHPAWLPRNDI
jgi:hypothetical protein